MMIPPRLRLFALILAVVGLLLAGAASLRIGTAGASGETVLTLVPVGSPRAGELITLKLVVRNAQNLAGFQGTVHYDPASLRLTGAALGTDIGRGGRGVLPLGPVMGDTSLILGAATCPISNCASPQPAHAARVEGGVSGSVDLGTLELYSASPGSSQLSLDGVKLVDPQGNTLPARAETLVLEVR